MDDTGSDPRLRPPDPAGTQPKVDPESLKPSLLKEIPALSGEPATDLLPQPQPQTGSLAAATSPQVESHAPRFQFLFGALGALGVAAVALGVFLLFRPTPAPSAPWSDWVPSGSGGDPAQQIADHVAPMYQLAPGKQLLQISGGPQSVGGQPVVLALRTSGSTPAPLPNNGVFYQLCGSGPNCSIAGGKASIQRGLLVRREALELALYTFRYISGASQVLVTFPPPPPSSSTKSKHATSETSSLSPTSSLAATAGSKTPNHVLLFRPSDLASELSRPLDASLSKNTPTASTMNASSDATLVNLLTAHALYDSVLIQEQQSSPVLLLQPPSLGG